MKLIKCQQYNILGFKNVLNVDVNKLEHIT